VIIEGTHNLSAQKALVWSLLHNPDIIRLALPGCEQFDQVSATEFAGLLIIPNGPFSGNYRGTIALKDIRTQESFNISLNGEGPEGTVWAEGHISISQQGEHTSLSYTGDLEVAGPAVAKSPRLLQTTARALIRQFFEEIDRYIQIQTGVYTTEISEPSPGVRRSGTIDMQDRIAEIRQNRRTMMIVVTLFVLASLMTLGATVIAIVIVRWGLRFFKQYVARVAQEGQQSSLSNSTNPP
jgi:carbon monoxide dehydrogenase subunit G